MPISFKYMPNIEFSPDMGPDESVYYTDLKTRETNTPPVFEAFLELQGVITESNRLAKQAAVNLGRFEQEINELEDDEGVDLDMHDSLVRRHERSRDALFWLSSIATVIQDPEAILEILKVKAQLIDDHRDDEIIAIGTEASIPAHLLEDTTTE